MVKRNKLAFAAGTAVALALLTGLGVSTYLYFVARRNGETSAKAASIMGELLAASEDAEEWYRSEVNGESMDKLADDLGTGFDDQPILEMRLRRVIGIRYARIKEFAKADAMFRRALAIERKKLGEPSYFLLSEFAPVLESEGKLAEAEAMHRQALEALQKTPHTGTDTYTPDSAAWNGSDTANQLVKVLLAEGKLGEAEQVARETLKIGKNEEAIAPDREDVFEAASYYRLATVLLAQDHPTEAEASLREALAHARRQKLHANEVESELLNRGDLLQSLASLLSHRKAFAEARPLAEEAATWFRSNRGYGSEERLGALKVLDEILIAVGDDTAHKSVFADRVAVLRSLISSDSPQSKRLVADLLTPAEERSHPRDFATVLTARGDVRVSQSRWQEAVTDYTRAIELDPTATALMARGEVYGGQGRWREATADFARAIELDPTNHPAWYKLAPLLMQAGDTARYRAHRKAMLERFPATDDRKDTTTMRRTAKACLLLPAEDPELTAASKLADAADALAEVADKAAERAEMSGNSALTKFSKGLAEFRRGEFAKAVSTLQKITEYARRDIQDCAILAMAFHRLNEPAEAHAALAKARELAAANVPSLDGNDLGTVGGTSWHNALIAHLLLREAKALLGEK